jgi:NTE family protein
MSPARIRENINRGYLEALTVSCTEVQTGRTVCFVQNNGEVPRWTSDPRRVARKAAIGPEHALASAAIPFLFPAVQVGGRYFCDGSLRQPTPLSPALRLGADRVLVIALRFDRRRGQAPIEKTPNSYPNALFLFGKLLNALLLDPIQYDLAVLERVNRILRHGRDVYGPSFEKELNAVVAPLRGKPYRIVDDLLVSPSRDIGMIAAEEVKRMKSSDWGSGPAALLFKRFAKSESDSEADLLSYLLFDGAYASRLVQTGYEDAAAQEEKLLAFFSDEPFEYD